MKIMVRPNLKRLIKKLKKSLQQKLHCFASPTSANFGEIRCARLKKFDYEYNSRNEVEIRLLAGKVLDKSFVCKDGDGGDLSAADLNSIYSSDPIKKKSTVAHQILLQ